MRLRVVGAGLAVALLASGGGVAQDDTRAGYLLESQIPDAALVIPPAPATGSERERVDMAFFRATRALEGTLRWELAQADNDYSPRYLVRAFSCAAGFNIPPSESPVTQRILLNMLRDTSVASRTAKEVYSRPRPYLIEDANICIPKSESLAESPDYPSGHTTLGWAAALILAELIPDRAEEILVRGRAYGESRLVCGVHSPGAVAEGRTTGALTVAAMHGSPEFMADMATAKAELAALRADPANAVDTETCGAEWALITASPFTP